MPVQVQRFFAGPLSPRSGIIPPTPLYNFGDEVHLQYSRIFLQYLYNILKHLYNIIQYYYNIILGGGFLQHLYSIIFCFNPHTSFQVMALWQNGRKYPAVVQKMESDGSVSVQVRRKNT